MAEDPTVNPNPYVDSQNVAFEQQLAGLLNGKQITDLTLQEARELIRQSQSPAPKHPNVGISHFNVTTSYGEVKAFVYRPKNVKGDLPFVYHLHGGGWFLGSAFAYEAFVFDLVTRTGFAVVLPEYTLAPAEKFPVQQEQCIEVLQWFVQHGGSKGLLVDKIAISGDSAGGQLAPAVSILNHQRSLNLPIVHQILMHPVVNATSLTQTFSQFKFQDGPFLSNGFIGEAFTEYFGSDIKDRSSITASPGLMTQAQVKEFMPPTTIITSQADWLRDQGQDFAKLLQTAGLDCGVVQGVALLHDAEIFNMSRESKTVELIMIMIAGKLREVLESDFLAVEAVPS